MAVVLITGGTGMIGTALSKLLTSKGYNVIILSRQTQPATNNQQPVTALWNPQQQAIDSNAIQHADYIINLAGANVGSKRWTAKRKQEIVQSRIQSGQTLVKALHEIPNNIKAVISASAIGWYGPDPEVPKKGQDTRRMFVETDPADNSFLGDTCRQWEESIDPVSLTGKRLVKLRIGIVLDRNGGAYKEFRKPVKFGFATILGNGKQVVSWIHIDDICRIILAAVENEKMEGVYNAVAPGPVTNKELILSLAKKIKGKFFTPIYVPAFLLKPVLGEMSIEVLKSATVSCDKIHRTGFQFLFPSLDAALNELTGK